MLTAVCALMLSALLAFAVAEKPWWLKVAQMQGPMVCAEEYVNGNERHFSTPWTGGSLCGKETIVRYSCCYGYGRVAGERGCSLVKPLKNLAETSEDVGAKKFIKQAEQSSLLPMLSTRGAYTVFAARDDAFRSLTKEQSKALNSSKRSRSRPPVLLYTMVEGRIPAEELPDSLQTLYREGSVVVTKFPTGLITVNCIPLVTTNLEATNGLLHITETLLLPTGRSTVSDLLVRTPALSTTATTTVRAQLSNELRDRKPITVFSPTDEAWESLPQSFMDALMEDSSSLKVLLQYHVVESVWCSAVSAAGNNLKTMEGSTLRISCNASGQYVNDARIISADHTAGNGFVHHIDKVLVPDRVRSLLEYLQVRGLTTFLKLVEAGGLLSLLQKQDAYTILVPTNDAFIALPNETFSNIFNDSAVARSVASFHVASGRHLTSKIIDGQKLLTIRGAEPHLRWKSQKKRVTVETALVEEADLEARNGVIQIIDQVLLPPTTTILEQLLERNFSTFSGLLNQTKPNLLKLLENSSSIFTVFAPSDSALNATPPGMLNRLLAEPQLLYQIMSNHILENFVVSLSLEPYLVYSYKSVSGQHITVSKSSDGFMTVAGLAEVITPDVTATNGIFHEISRLIQL